MTIEKTDFTKNINNIYNDIIEIEIDENDSFKTSLNKFYDVMRKWGICQGNWSGNGRTCCTAEWNMCYQVFKTHKILSLDTWLILSEPPEDLLAYGEKPNNNNNSEIKCQHI